MDYSTFYNPNSKSSSSSTPILVPSSCSTRATNTRNGKKKGNNNNNNNYNNQSRSSSSSNNNNKNNNNRSSSSSSNNNNNNNNNKGGVRLSTDPQSIAARERRHRISDRFKMLQSLVPGGAKLDTVSLLDQAIQYVNFLKSQILLHEAITKNNTNNNNVNNFTINNQDHINNSTATTINDAHYDDDQYYYALMYDCTNYGSQQEGGSAGGAVGNSEGDFDGGACNPQEMNMAATPAAINYQAAQILDGWNYYQGNYQQSMYYKRALNYY